MFRNLRVLQNTGWISTTLTEIRNRADLLVVACSDMTRRFPRFFERCFGDFETLFETGNRKLWFLGRIPDELPAALRRRTKSLAIEPAGIAELFAALRTLLAGRDLRATQVAGVPMEQVGELLMQMRSARYGVLTWAAGDFMVPHADLGIQSMCEFVRALNVETRFSVLPLGGNEGDMTALQVTTWQTGFPIRVNFSGGAPAQDPLHDSARHLLQQAEVDAMLFVSALDASCVPPEGSIPRIVLGRAGMRTGGCAAFIPVAVPGLHHAGHLYRGDNVVAMRLRKLAASTLPSAAEALQQILAAL
jgi:formylmethanofuran dehydrogenase subunit B